MLAPLVVRTGSGQFQEPFSPLAIVLLAALGLLVASSSAGFAFLSVRPWAASVLSGCSHVAIAVRHDGKFRDFLPPSPFSEQSSPVLQ